jgi:hypothetical protein
MEEIARLFGRFRELTASFYDPEDLLQAAAARLRASHGVVLPELGAVYVVPPSRFSAAEAAFLDAIAGATPSYEEVEDPWTHSLQSGQGPSAHAGNALPEERFILAPDAASEARAIAREVIGALQGGLRLDEIAVFYSGDRAYRALLTQTLEAAAIPVASMPGTPLNELAAGRGALALARLPLQEYSRVDLFDFLALAPLRGQIPGVEGETALRVSHWRRIAREAGVTHGIERWRDALGLFAAERESALALDGEISEGRRRLYESD